MRHNLEASSGRCVFSEFLKEQTLGVDAGEPPGALATGQVGVNRVSGWRAVVRVLRSPAGRAASLFDDVVTTIFPADCRCCGGPLLRAGLVPVCDACTATLKPSSLPGCGQCGESIEFSLGIEDLRFAAQMAAHLRCRECRMAPPAYRRAVSFATYEGELRTLIGLFKFEGVSGLAKPLGDRLAEAVSQLEGSAANELLVIAVPLFPARERQRGYNQSVLLADRAVRRLRTLRPSWNLTAAHPLLKRVRRTEAQYALALRDRRRNLKGAFEVAGDVQRREVLLVDDIMTSGATARECARVLQLAGAAKVWVATLARAQKHEFAHMHEDPGDHVATWGSADANP